MQGIEILNRTEVTVKPIWAWILLIVCVVVGVVAYAVYESNINTIADLICGILVIICIIGGVFALAHDEPTGKYQYEAIIDENVSIQEIYEKYNVIEQYGKKWILIDKECAE